ncbi:MAG: class II aldolase/adducin family protein [Rhodospirillaceae bacterium]|nr:class II aldolase/adducin family protein [Rhodospirillaceae bacterium]
MTDRDTLIADLVTANRILAHEGVVDGFGHVSLRDPGDAGRYLISVSRSPELVDEGDIVALGLDGEPAGPSAGETRALYLERPIHGAIYAARPDVGCIVHNHSLSVIPFGVTGAPLKPVFHMASGIGDTIPVWDIRDRFGDTNMLVTTQEQGEDLARTLAGHSVALMRGHGCVVAGAGLRDTVMKAIYLETNAALLLAARPLGDIRFLFDGEMALSWATNTGANPLKRAWDYWAARAGR